MEPSINMAFYKINVASQGSTNLEFDLQEGQKGRKAERGKKQKEVEKVERGRKAERGEKIVRM